MRFRANCPYIPAILLLSVLFSSADLSADTVFSNIYKDGLWGRNEKGEAHSGGGSSVKNVKLYMQFLQKFLKEKNIRSVVDVGCGDWEFSQYINWTSIDYKGFDIVESVIEKNRARFSSPTISFSCQDCIHTELPEADLLICKDVLQHLSNEDIQAFLSQCRKYKYCLITNDIDPITYSSQNISIERGKWRCVDITKPPFNISGEKVLTYRGDVLKQVVLIRGLRK